MVERRVRSGEGSGAGLQGCLNPPRCGSYRGLSEQAVRIVGRMLACRIRWWVGVGEVGLPGAGGGCCIQQSVVRWVRERHLDWGGCIVLSLTWKSCRWGAQGRRGTKGLESAMVGLRMWFGLWMMLVTVSKWMLDSVRGRCWVHCCLCRWRKLFLGDAGRLPWGSERRWSGSVCWG